jgi:hypothetical protein
MTACSFRGSASGTTWSTPTESFRARGAAVSRIGFATFALEPAIASPAGSQIPSLAVRSWPPGEGRDATRTSPWCPYPMAVRVLLMPTCLPPKAMRPYGSDRSVAACEVHFCSCGWGQQVPKLFEALLRGRWRPVYGGREWRDQTGGLPAPDAAPSAARCHATAIDPAKA